MSVKQNDWVRSYSKGIWRVVREVPPHFEPRYSFDEPKELYNGPSYIVKRLVNDKWKRAFAMESAHGSFIRELSAIDSAELSAFLAANPEMLREFEAFSEPLYLMLNLGFSLERRTDIRRLKEEVGAAIRNLSSGVTSDAIVRAIAQTSFASSFGESPQTATLQFVNLNSEIRRRELIYREMDALDF